MSHRTSFFTPTMPKQSGTSAEPQKIQSGLTPTTIKTEAVATLAIDESNTQISPFSSSQSTTSISNRPITPDIQRVTSNLEESVKTSQPIETASIVNGSTSSTNNTKTRQTKEEIQTSQELLHRSITEIRYFSAPTISCCCFATIRKLYNFILFAIFGQQGYFLGAAKDDRVSIKEENKSIQNYEKSLKALVEHIKSNEPDSSEEENGKESDALFDIMNDFYIKLMIRIMQIAKMNPSQSVSDYFEVALQEVDSVIKKHNKENPKSKINEKWLEQVKGGLLERNRDSGFKEKASEAFINGYAAIITPDFIKKNGLQSLADFAVSYVNVFGYPENGNLETPVAMLREAVYESIVASGKRVKDEGEFAFFLLKNPNEEELQPFMKAIFDNYTASENAGQKPAQEWYISA
jgi:hypothetical protein